MTTVSRLRSSAEISSFLRSFCICVGQHGHSLLAQQRNIINQTTFSLGLNRRYRMQATALQFYTQHLSVTLPWMGKISALAGDGMGQGGLSTAGAGFSAGLSWRWLLESIIGGRLRVFFSFSSISTGGLLVSEIDPASHGKGLSS